MWSVEAVAPDQRGYEVAVDWLPRPQSLIRSMRAWRRKRMDDNGSLLDVTPDVGDDLVVGIVLTVVLVVAILLFWWVILPVLLTVLDIVAVLLLAVAAGVFRVVFRRPWTVAVRPRAEEDVLARAGVVGWRPALRARDAIAAELTRGATPLAAVTATVPDAARHGR